MRSRNPERILVWAALAAAVLLSAAGQGRAFAGVLTPQEAREVAREATVYGFPLVDSYRIQHAYFVDRSTPEFKGDWNQLSNVSRVFTPEDKAIQTPNSDTPYSFLGLDLRAEPLVLTLPKVEAGRYYSVQLIDAYTHNFAYLGTRETGQEGGRFLVAGPGWKGKAPKGIDRVIRSETAFNFALYRTQLLNPGDIDAVKAIQAGYKVETLSQHLGRRSRPAPVVKFTAPLSPEAQRTSLDFFRVLNFTLSFGPVNPADAEKMKRFARIGVGPGHTFDPERLGPGVPEALKQGMADAWKDFAAYKAANIDTGKVTSGDVFGTRAFLAGDDMKRMTGAVLGIYGNSREEAMYPAYFVDAAGKPLNGANGTYALRFAPGQLPPVDAFWSLTLYEMPSSLLSANPLNRYLINSAMLPDLKRDPDGGLTLFVGPDRPEGDRSANWLPSPRGPFSLFLRLYLPKGAVLDGSWKAPAVTLAEGGLETVTPATYIRAETDRSFANIAKLAGGVNRFYAIRRPTPLDAQTIVRMNKDTLYSSAIVDTEGGATLTLPKPDKGRYMSALLVDNDHYAPRVIYTPGTHQLPTDTKYLSVVVRVQVFNPDDPAELERVHRLQDQVVLKTTRSDPLPPPRWDPASLQVLTRRYEEESKAYPSWKGMMGPRGKVDEKTRHIAAAAAWGLFPEEDATYLNYAGDEDISVCRVATYKVPDNKAFWSITVYGADGYMKSNRSIVNSSNVRLNPNGTFTVHYGSAEVCGERANRLDVTPGWNFLMRIYRPGPSVVSGAYALPKAVPVG